MNLTVIAFTKAKLGFAGVVLLLVTFFISLNI